MVTHCHVATERAAHYLELFHKDIGFCGPAACRPSSGTPTLRGGQRGPELIGSLRADNLGELVGCRVLQGDALLPTLTAVQLRWSCSV